jgi:ribosomal protein S3AE
MSKLACAQIRTIRRKMVEIMARCMAHACHCSHNPAHRAHKHAFVFLQIRTIRRKMVEIMAREASSCDLKDLVAKFIP